MHKYQFSTKNPNQNLPGDLMFIKGWPGAYFYSRLPLTPSLAWNLIEDSRDQSAEALCGITAKEFAWLLQYTPSMPDRAEKVRLLRERIISETSEALNSTFKDDTARRVGLNSIFLRQSTGITVLPQTIAKDILNGDQYTSTITIDEIKRGFEVWSKENAAEIKNIPDYPIPLPF